MKDPYEPELRLGRWQHVSGEIEADVVICDPPYGARVHSFKQQRNDSLYEAPGSVFNPAGLAPKYDHLTQDQIREFVEAWHPRCRGWMVALSCSDLSIVWRSEFSKVGRYAFAPVPCVISGMTVRLTGDGPSSWTVYANVARPATKEYATWGTLPGAYTGPQVRESSGGRGKPDWLMQALVRDYSRTGDLIVDPFCGWGSTLAAAQSLRRRSIGIDVDADALAESRRRLSRPVQEGLFT